MSVSFRKLRKASDCCQRLANGLQFPAKDCNFLPGFGTYQRITGEWQTKKPIHCLARIFGLGAAGKGLTMQPFAAVRGFGFLRRPAALRRAVASVGRVKFDGSGQRAFSTAVCRTNIEQNAGLDKKMLDRLGARTPAPSSALKIFRHARIPSFQPREARLQHPPNPQPPRARPDQIMLAARRTGGCWRARRRRGRPGR